MSINMDTVPVLRRADAERAAGQLLQEASDKLGMQLKPPIDVEVIADNHLGLQIVYRDLLSVYGDSNIHGGLHIPDKQIMVEETLSVGRINFTLGHEVGHWVLHRHLAQLADPNQSALFGVQESQPIHRYSPTMCRSSDKSWGERQADWFAAALMMPARAVRAAFKRHYSHPQVFNRSVLKSFKLDYHAEDYPKISDTGDARWEVLQIVDLVKETGRFSNVSNDAFRVRLETLQLIVSETGQGRIL